VCKIGLLLEDKRCILLGEKKKTFNQERRHLMSAKPLDFSKHNLMIDPAKAGSRGCFRRFASTDAVWLVVPKFIPGLGFIFQEP
jgi:hypothetical protein